MSEPTPLTEDQVALRLGVSREWVREHRGPEGERWFRGPTRAVLWRQEAVDALLGEMGATASPEAPVDDVVVMIVTWCRFPNHKVMEVHAESSAPETPRCICWVADARRFDAGQRILARPFPGREGVFMFAGDPGRPAIGPVLPSRPGMWP